jgi:TonB family protein
MDGGCARLNRALSPVIDSWCLRPPLTTTNNPESSKQEFGFEEEIYLAVQLRPADTPGVEVSVPHPRTAISNVLFVFLVIAFLISGIITASPNPTIQQGQIPQQPIGIGIDVLSSRPEGVNFDPYLRNLRVSISLKLVAKLPKSAANGENGVVVVRVHIQKDGSLPDDSVKIVSSSGKKDMDAAALTAIRTAAPFGRLPEAYLGSNLELLVTFDYKNIPKEPAHKPKLVPVG